MFLQTFVYLNLCREQAFKLLLANLLFLNQKLGTGMKYILMLHDDILRLGVAVIDDALHFAVNRIGNLVAVALGVSQIAADEDLVAVIVVVNHTDTVRHTVLGHHGTGRRCRLLNILGCTGGNIAEDQFFCDSAA